MNNGISISLIFFHTHPFFSSLNAVFLQLNQGFQDELHEQGTNVMFVLLCLHHPDKMSYNVFHY